MQSELKSLSKIFSESIFRIPDYQRGYSWQERQLKDFWNDIEQLSENKSHYTGVLTLEPVKEVDFMKWEDDVWIIKSKLYTPLYIVDGQQRLTTIVILLQSILETADKEAVLNYTSQAEIRKKYIFESKDQGISRSYIFGYEKDNPSYEFLKRSVYCEASETHAVPEATIYTANLRKAKEYFLGKLKTASIEDLENIYTKVTQHLHFNIFYIEPELDVFVTFETMNNRGKPLSHLELLKNRLIYLSTRFQEDKIELERLRKKINESWKTIYHYLGKNESRRLQDDAFLRTHFLAYYGPTLPLVDLEDPDNSDYDVVRFMRRDELYKTELLENIFNIRRIYSPNGKPPLTMTELDGYAQDIKACVELYYQLFDPDQSSFSDSEKIELHRLNRLAGHGLRLFTLIAMQTVNDVDKRLTLLVTLERFTFLSRIKPYSFRDLDIDQISLKLKAKRLSVQEAVRLLENTCKVFLDSPEFTDAVRTIGKSDGYYGWSGLRYFMYEYEQYLRTRSKADREMLSWEEFTSEDFDSDHKSIEHIYPQKMVDPYWKERFSKYSLPERNVLRHSLGNLLPISSAKNSSLGNKSFPLKRGSIESQVGYMYGCLSEVQVSQQLDWNALTIAARGISLLEFMEKRWNLTLGTDEKKLELLGLGFVLNREGVDIVKLRDSFLTAVKKLEPKISRKA